MLAVRCRRFFSLRFLVLLLVDRLWTLPQRRFQPRRHPPSAAPHRRRKRRARLAGANHDPLAGIRRGSPGRAAHTLARHLSISRLGFQRMVNSKASERLAWRVGPQADPKLKLFCKGFEAMRPNLQQLFGSDGRGQVFKMTPSSSLS